MLHEMGVDIYNPASPATPIDGYNLPSQTSLPEDVGALVAFHQDGVGERLAALIEDGNGAKLWILDDSGEQNYALSVLDPYALAVGDVDADGSDDLLVAHRDTTADGPSLYINQEGSGNPFPTEVELALGVPWTAPSSAQKAVPVIDDFTSDGDLDIAWYSEEEANMGEKILRVAENLSIDHTGFFIGLQTVRSHAWLYPEFFSGKLATKFALPGEPPSFSANWIILEEWYQDATDHPMHWVGVQAFKRAYPTTSAQWNALHEFWLWPTADVPMNGLTHITIRAIQRVEERDRRSGTSPGVYDRADGGSV